MDQIPFVVHEADMTRMERTNRRVWILCIILIALLFATNAGWLYYESQFQYFENTVEQEVDTGEGDATVIGIGDYNGESETNNNE
jgi:hypothetical protein